jgi:hypothetical protein
MLVYIGDSNDWKGSWKSLNRKTLCYSPVWGWLQPESEAALGKTNGLSRRRQ